MLEPIKFILLEALSQDYPTATELFSTNLSSLPVSNWQLLYRMTQD
ncbi:hypothetical protein LCGC14_3051990, partial [marine sediment metagenome]